MALTLALEYGENFSQSIDLNQFLEHREGLQALSGLTGMGLPPVQVQWLEGAGDGAKARGRRVLARPIDLPLYMVSPNRAKLKQFARDLSVAISDVCRLRLRDSEETFDWYADVWRTGGGDFTYGEDTSGEYDLSLIISFQAGNPYFLQDRAVRFSAKPGDGAPVELVVNNPGTAPTYPVWTIKGPGISFVITNAKGDRLEYDGIIDLGQTRIIDTEQASIVDQDGTNRYDGAGDSVQMFTVPPGRSTLLLSVDQSSDAFIEAQAAGRTNHVTNPAFRVNATGWDLGYGTVYDASHKLIHNSESDYGDGDSGVLASTELTGLVPGTTYRATIKGAAGPKSATPSGHSLVARSKMALALVNDTQILSTEVTENTTGTLDVTFTAATDTATLRVTGGISIWKNTSTGIADTIKVEKGSVLGPAYVGEPGPIFDGDTADTAELNYSWTGTADASTSKEVVPLTDTDLTNVLVTCEIQPRDWMVV